MKVLVVGGSSGIGLSIVLNLCGDKEVERVYVLDKAPFPEAYANAKVEPVKCDLSTGDLSVLDTIDDIKSLYITAGFGHLDYLQDVEDDYIKNIFTVNTVSVIRIVRHYYSRMLSEKDFYCAMMVSIAGRVSSPLFSVYSATKAALRAFIEAVNVELDVQGSRNRILEVSPGSLKGTGFTGGESNPELTEALAVEIVERSRRHEEIYIPQYDEVFKGVIERYQADAHRYGVESYWYKKRQGRF